MPTRQEAINKLEEYFDTLKKQIIQLYCMYDEAREVALTFGDALEYIYEIYGGKIKIPQEIFKQRKGKAGRHFGLNVSTNIEIDGEHYIIIKTIDKEDNKDAK